MTLNNSQMMQQMGSRTRGQRTYNGSTRVLGEDGSQIFRLIQVVYAGRLREVVVVTPPPLSPIIPTADINVSPPSVNITIEGFLHHLLEAAKYVVDVDKLVRSARTSFRLIESRFEEISR
jgi:hypothetical protein